MLRGVVDALSGRGAVVSVVARSAAGLGRLVSDLERSGARAEPLALDYRDGDALTEALARAQVAHGPIDLAVCWIHSVAPGSFARQACRTPSNW